MTHALLAARHQGAGTPSLPSIDKWALFNDLRVARARYGVTDRDLSVLYALLTFLPAKTLADDAALVVFPSNASLSDRAHGMAESTLRRHLANLVAAGLIWRQDSPNGKRYARRDRSGALTQAYGFDLRPLLVRAEAITSAAAEVTALASVMAAAREALVLHMRDAAKLVAHGRDSALPGDWAALDARLTPLRAGLRRKLDRDTLAKMLAEAVDILALACLWISPATADPSATDAQYERHHTDSKPDSLESELGDDIKKTPAISQPAQDTANPRPMPHLPFDLIVKACPDLLPYTMGRLSGWRDLVAAVAKVRAMMGITASAWEEAMRVMGAETAAITVAAMLQRFDRIANPGGYLRALSAKAAVGGFSPGPMVMALLR